MKLIDIEKIKKLDKVSYYLDLLKTQYLSILKKELESSKKELNFSKKQNSKKESESSKGQISINGIKSSKEDISIKKSESTKEQKLKKVVMITSEFFHLILNSTKLILSSQ